MRSAFEKAKYHNDIKTIPAKSRSNLRKLYWKHPEIHCYMNFEDWLDKIGYTRGLAEKDRVYLPDGCWSGKTIVEERDLNAQFLRSNEELIVKKQEETVVVTKTMSPIVIRLIKDELNNNVLPAQIVLKYGLGPEEVIAISKEMEVDV